MLGLEDAAWLELSSSKHMKGAPSPFYLSAEVVQNTRRVHETRPWLCAGMTAHSRIVITLTSSCGSCRDTQVPFGMFPCSVPSLYFSERASRFQKDNLPAKQESIEPAFWRGPIDIENILPDITVRWVMMALSCRLVFDACIPDSQHHSRFVNSGNKNWMHYSDPQHLYPIADPAHVQLFTSHEAGLLCSGQQNNTVHFKTIVHHR